MFCTCRLEDPSHICTRCHKYFGDKESLDAHTTAKHGNARLPCSAPGCQKSFLWAKARIMHERTKHQIDRLKDEQDKVHQCEVCGKPFSKKVHLTQHMIKHSTETLSCDLCEQVFKTRSHLSRHKLTEHGVGVPCPHCGTKFASEKLLQKHWKSHGDDKNAGQKKCLVCDEYYFDIDSFAKHVETHDGQENAYKCAVCEDTFSRLASFHEHMLDKHSSHKCAECGMKFDCKANLENHVSLKRCKSRKPRRKSKSASASDHVTGSSHVSVSDHARVSEDHKYSNRQEEAMLVDKEVLSSTTRINVDLAAGHGEPQEQERQGVGRSTTGHQAPPAPSPALLQQVNAEHSYHVTNSQTAPAQLTGSSEANEDLFNEVFQLMDSSGILEESDVEIPMASGEKVFHNMQPVDSSTLGGQSALMTLQTQNDHGCSCPSQGSAHAQGEQPLGSVQNSALGQHVTRPTNNETSNANNALSMDAGQTDSAQLVVESSQWFHPDNSASLPSGPGQTSQTQLDEGTWSELHFANPTDLGSGLQSVDVSQSTQDVNMNQTQDISASVQPVDDVSARNFSHLQDHW